MTKYDMQPIIDVMDNAITKLNKIMNKKELQIYIKDSQGCLLEAQEACKNAIFKTSYKLKELHDLFKKKGYIEDYEIEVGILNSGYDLKVNTQKINYDKLPTNNYVFNFIMMGSRIYIQPECFYDDYFPKRKAHIEAKLIVTDKKQVDTGRYHVDRTPVEGADLKEVMDGIVELNDSRINHLLDQLK